MIIKYINKLDRIFIFESYLLELMIYNAMRNEKDFKELQEKLIVEVKINVVQKKKARKNK